MYRALEVMGGLVDDHGVGLSGPLCISYLAFFEPLCIPIDCVHRADCALPRGVVVVVEVMVTELDVYILLLVTDFENFCSVVI